MCQPPYFIKKFISTNRSRVKDPHFLAKKQPKMAIFEKPGYWGLKDPLEVRVQHETCIYMKDTFSSHFEPKKIDRVGRRGQKQPKLGIFEGTNIATHNSDYQDLYTKPKTQVDLKKFNL